MQMNGSYRGAKLHMAGETLLIVNFGAELTPAINDAVIAFDHYLQNNSIEGYLESAPSSRSVTVCFDPLIVAPEKFRSIILQALAEFEDQSGARSVTPKRWRFPVLYGGEAGPDLGSVAKRLDLPEDDVITAHLSTIQRVFMIGFAPGFLYTGMLPELFNLPRLATIKPHVPAGSVSVAIGQTVISSTPNPTGWHTIGRTPFANFDPSRQPPVLINAGDEIEFYAIDQSEYKRLSDGSTEAELYGEAL